MCQPWWWGGLFSVRGGGDGMMPTLIGGGGGNSSYLLLTVKEFMRKVVKLFRQKKKTPAILFPISSLQTSIYLWPPQGLLDIVAFPH